MSSSTKKQKQNISKDDMTVDKVFINFHRRKKTCGLAPRRGLEQYVALLIQFKQYEPRLA